MSDKSEKTLVWVNAVAILTVLLLIGGWTHVKEVILPAEQVFRDKLFDIGLVLFGTWFGYVLAKWHLEHTVKQMDSKYLDLNRNIAFHKAVGAMLPELPNFHLRQSTGFSSDVATAVAEFTSWSTALDPTHTPDKSMELVAKEAHTLAAGLINKDIGFREEETEPNYEWTICVHGLPGGWEVQELPDISIYNWDTAQAVQTHALMGEVERTADSITHSWKWNMTHVSNGTYIAVVNYQIGGRVVTGNIVGNRLKIHFRRNDQALIKTHDPIPWD